MFFKKTVRIVIKDKNLAFEVKTGANLYTTLVEENVINPTLCRGNGQCGKCKVRLTGKNVAKPNKKEQLVLAKINLDAGYRLACQTVIKGDMVVDTSDISMGSMPDDVFLRPVDNSSKKFAREESFSILEASTEDVMNIDLEQEESLTYVEPVRQVTSFQSDSPTEVLPGAASNALAEKKNVTPQKNLSSGKAEQRVKANSYDTKDGLLFIQQKGAVRYFLYSAVIDAIAQEGTIKDPEELASYIKQGMLSDYMYNVLKIKDIDRIIIISDEEVYEGEPLFDVASYVRFDIGELPCELIRPLPHAGDISLFMRMLNVKGKKKLMVCLDKLSHAYYFSDDATVKIPLLDELPENIFSKFPEGINPVTGISDDLRELKTVDPYNAPDSLPMHILLKTVAALRRMGIADSEMVIASRSELGTTVPIEYVIKIAKQEAENVFFLYRDKGASLVITQRMMTNLFSIKKYMYNIINYVEQNLGNIDSIIINTPVNVPGLITSVAEIGLVPKRYENNVIHNYNDSSVTAIRFFQEQDVPGYIKKYFGTFYTPE